MEMSNGAFENILAVSPKFNIVLPYDAEIPLLDMYRRELETC